jgi:hypothetical protein
MAYITPYYLVHQQAIFMVLLQLEIQLKDFMQIFHKQLLQQLINSANLSKFKNFWKEMLVAVLATLKLFVVIPVLLVLMLAYNVLNILEEVQPRSISIQLLKRQLLDKLAQLPLWATLVLWVLPWLIAMDLLNRLLSMV